MLDLYIDIDSCVSFSQLLRAAQRHSLEVYVITRDHLDAEPNVHLIFAQENGGAAREWIAANISRADICITDDTALASSCMLRGAVALTPNGAAWTSELLLAAGPQAKPGNSSSVKKFPAGVGGEARMFPQRLDAAIAVARAVAGRPSLHASGFDHFGSGSAVRRFPRPRRAVG